MKLASAYNGSRDGQLLIVSRDLKTATYAPASLAPTLQTALDNWQDVSPALERLYGQLNRGEARLTLDFSALKIMAPLPRAYHWADGSAYVNHVELVRRARGAELPPSFWTDPLIYQGGSDDFIGPSDPIECPNPEWGIDLEAEVAVIVNDISMGLSALEIRESGAIKLLMLVNDVSLRNLIPSELAKGFGFYQSKPATSFSPIALTPDELTTEEWDGGKLHLPLRSFINDQLLGEPYCHIDMTFDFPTLIAHAAKTRNLRAGAIIGSGTVSNYDRSRGSSCLAEKRLLQKMSGVDENKLTPWLNHGDNVRIEMLNQKGESLFGAINQFVQIKNKE